MDHLTSEELVDGVDRALPSDRRAHLDECALCRQQVDDLRRTLRDLHASDVPEPSPMFWTHFSERVQKAIAEEPQPHATWLPAWVGWRVATPIAALALLVAALVNAVPRERSAPQGAPAATAELNSFAPSIDAEPLNDASWRLVSELAEDMDLDDTSNAGFVIPGVLERAASELSPTERAELLRLLRAELGRPES